MYFSYPFSFLKVLHDIGTKRSWYLSSVCCVPAPFQPAVAIIFQMRKLRCRGLEQLTCDDAPVLSDGAETAPEPLRLHTLSLSESDSCFQSLLSSPCSVVSRLVSVVHSAFRFQHSERAVPGDISADPEEGSITRLRGCSPKPSGVLPASSPPLAVSEPRP